MSKASSGAQPPELVRSDQPEKIIIPETENMTYIKAKELSALYSLNTFAAALKPQPIREVLTMLRKSLFSLFILLLLPLTALAIPAITCHCFTDRSFDPARPAVADPYFLATTQNTFFSIVFGLNKKSIVLMKQKGTPADDLWIAYRVAELSDTTPETLLLARASKASWSEVLGRCQGSCRLYFDC